MKIKLIQQTRMIEDSVIRFVGEDYFNDWMDKFDPIDDDNYFTGIYWIYLKLMKMTAKQLENQKKIDLLFNLVMANFNYGNLNKKRKDKRS